MLVAQKDVITKITGIITPKSIDTLENELGGAFTILKSTHFTDGQHYGFLASIIPEDKYTIVIPRLRCTQLQLTPARTRPRPLQQE
jgi:hypothetical protein